MLLRITRLIFALLFCHPPTAVSQECAAPPSGVVACWKGEGTAADAVGGHHGILEGDATFGVGKSGGGFLFSGNGSVTVANSPELQLNHLSIVAWVKPILLDGHVDIILNKEIPPATSIQYEIGIRGTDHAGEGTIPVGNLAFFLGGISGLPDDFQSWVDGAASVPLDTWSHVALTFDGSRATVYFNGSPTRTLSGLSGTITTTTGPLKIGARTTPAPGWLNIWFNGSIDEVALFNRALTSAEVLAVYQGNTAGLCCEEPIPVEITTWGRIKRLVED